MFHASLWEKVYKIGFIKFNMISNLISLASYGFFGGGAIGNILAQWEQAGIFSYMLPFLLIFAMIFGVLTKINLFKENKSINAIIALAVSLMSLQFDFVSIFFAELFPRMAIGLIVLLVAMILLGMFSPNEKWVNYTFFGIAAVVLISVLVKSAKAVSFFGGGGFLGNIYWPDLLPWIILIVVLGVIVGASTKRTSNPAYGPSVAIRDLFGLNHSGK